MTARSSILASCVLTLATVCGQAGVAVAETMLPLRQPSAAVEALTPPEPTPQSQRAWRRLQLASAYFEQGQTDVALQEVRAALRIDPRDAQAFNLLGLIHQHRNAADLAEQSFQQALHLASGDKHDTAVVASVAHNYGWFLCERAQYAQGQSMLTQALAQPSTAAASGQAFKTWLVLGDCQQQAGDTAQAQRSWRQALAIEPHNPWLQKRLSAAAAVSPSVE